MKPALCRAIASCVALVTLLSAVQVAHAQDAYACIDDMNDAQVTERLHFIERSFERTERRGRLWYWGFWSLMLGLAVGETIITTQERSEAGRVDGAVGAAGATFVLLTLTVQPFLGAFGARRLRRHAAATPEQRRQKLRYATRLLERSATQERFLTSWLAHGSAWLYSMVVGTLMLRRYHAPWRAAIGYLGGVFITEPRLLSQPMAQVRDFERYRGDTCSAPYVGPDDGPRYELSLRPAPGGLGLAFSF
ncbi:MAG: hypothetical protein GXP55_10880 [Deltaproteobacteria bacterium]|nr:hypothetical protein [Deltaproteobacteria bacterium]